MDRPVKERLIGASILVVLVVAVVPELLSGPKPSRPAATAVTSDAIRLSAGASDPARDVVRNVTVDLATSKPAVPEVNVPNDGAAPVSTAPVSTAPAGTAPASTAPASTAPVSTAPVHKPDATAFVVQLGSFAKPANADKLLRQLKPKGFPIYTSAEGSGAAARYRVRVGPFADREAAERAVAKLKNLGHPATIVGR